MKNSFLSFKGRVLSPIFAVEAAQLNGFCHVRCANHFRGVKVGYGACHAQNAVISACAQSHTVVCRGKEGGSIRIQGAIALNTACIELCVAKNRGILSHTFACEFSCSSYAFANGSRGVGFGIGRRDLIVGKRGEFYLNVHSVKHWSANAGDVTLDVIGTASAGVCGVTEVSATAGVHSTHQHKRAGECHTSVGACNGHAAILKRLTQGIGDLLGELG